MESKKKNLIIRRLLIALVILALAVLQSIRGGINEIFGIRALILIPAVVAAAMYEREIAGVLYGLLAGALWDIFAAGNNFNAIFLVITGFASAMLINIFMRNNFVTHLIISAGAAGIYSLIYWLYHFVIINSGGAFYMLIRYYLPGVILTAVLSPLIFLLIRALEKKYYTDINSLYV